MSVASLSSAYVGLWDDLGDEADVKVPTSRCVLIVCEDDGAPIRWSTGDNTKAGREALQEQADRMVQYAYVLTEFD